MMDAQGKDYKYSQPFYEMYMGENSSRTVEDIEEEENNFE